MPFLFQHTLSNNQEQKIIQQIHSINKKLNKNNSHKNINQKNSYIQTKNNQIQNQNNQHAIFQNHYFSQEQYDELFQDQNQQLSHSSLFNTNKDMLLDPQQCKQVKNFKNFQTNKLSDISAKFDSIQNSSNRLNISKNNNKSLTQKVYNAMNQTQDTKINQQRKNRELSHIKKIAEEKIKKYIKDKENIQPFSNQQTFKNNQNDSKSEKNNRFETISDQYLLNESQSYKFYDQEEQQDSLQSFKFQKRKPHSHFNHCQKNRHKNNKFEQNHHNTLQCTFKPQIIKKSHQIAENLQPSFERLTQDNSKSQLKLPYRTKEQLSTKKYSIKRLDQLSQPRRLKTSADVQQEIQKPTFKPSLSKKSLEQMANCTLNVASRNKLWLEQKQAKIKIKKIQEEEQKIKKQISSFAPKINHYKGQSEVYMSRFAKQGMVSYFQRLSMAKQRISVNEKKKPLTQMTKNLNFPSQKAEMKKKTYDEAVKELHRKILAMNI